MSNLKKYLLTIGAGFFGAFVVAYSQGIFNATTAVEIFHILSDSFFVPSVLIMGMGGLVFVSNEGAFDGLTFALTSFADVFRKQKKNKYTTYYDYKQSKGNRDRSFGFLLITGAGFFLVSGIMLLLYHI